jgi:mannosyltransferase
VTVLSDAPTRASRPAPQVSDRRRPLLIAAAIVIGLGGLLLYFACRSDMWLDEALSVNIARLPLSDLRQALKHDGAPPLYYVLLHVWTGVFGTGDLAARSLSGLCMAVAVVVTWFAARRFGGTRVAWLAAIVMLANPFAIRYATETRMYALEILLVAAGIVAFQRMLDSPTVGRAAVFGVLVALSIYNQYWAFYLVGVVIVALVWMLWRDVHRVAARRLLIATAIGLVTFVPWLPTFMYQRAHTGTPWGKAILPGLPIAYTLRDFAGGSLLQVDL